MEPSTETSTGTAIGSTTGLGARSVARRSRQLRWAGALTTVLALLMGSFTYFNTNAFTDDRLCHGWITTEQAREVLGGKLGRVNAHDDSPLWCTVTRTGWFPGSGDTTLTIRTSLMSEDFPFDRSGWDVAGDMHINTAGRPGAYDAARGWTLLPDACAPELRSPAWAGGETPVVFGSVTEKTSPLAMARLLNSAARTIAGSTLCGTPSKHETGGDGRVYTPTATSRTDLGEVCGIPGLSLGKVTGPREEEVQEQTSGSLKSPGTDWVCDLSFEDGEIGEPFVRFAVVRSPRLVDLLKNPGFEIAECGGQETVFAVEDLSYRLEPEEYEATGLPDSGLSAPFKTAAKKALKCTT